MRSFRVVSEQREGDAIRDAREKRGESEGRMDFDSDRGRSDGWRREGERNVRQTLPMLAGIGKSLSPRRNSKTRYAPATR